jgi:hypothetical protein
VLGCRVHDTCGVRSGIPERFPPDVPCAWGGPMIVIVSPGGVPRRTAHLPQSDAAAAFAAGTGWMDTYRPSQIIGWGTYRHGVK